MCEWFFAQGAWNQQWVRYAIQAQPEQTPADWTGTGADSSTDIKKKIVDENENDDILEPIFSEVKPGPEKAQSKQPASENTPPVKKKIRRLSSDISGPSIKDALAGKFNSDENISAKEQHEIYSRADEKEEFTKEQMKVKWEQFVKRLNDRPNLQSTLSATPELNEKFQLILEIDNSVQEDLINSVKPELVSWLRKELKNSKIQLVTKITQTEKEKIIYTDSEKYGEMLKKNPKLALLKQKFKLDFG